MKEEAVCVGGQKGHMLGGEKGAHWSSREILAESFNNLKRSP